MKITKIHPLVWVFHELVKNPEEIINFYEQEKEWTNWWTRGRLSRIFIANLDRHQTFPTEEVWNKELYKDLGDEIPKEYFIKKKITDAVYEASRLFFEANHPDIKDLSFFSFDIAKYFPGGAMTYHTDYDQERFFQPGPIFHTTALLYPNDNYEGGEVSFVELDNERNILWCYDYKPKAGDIVIFSSQPPIYHGVLPNLNAEKYLIRTYWRTYEEPTNEWKQGVLEYGEEQWLAKQQEKYAYLKASQMHKKFENRDMTITIAPPKEYDIILTKLGKKNKGKNE